MFVPRCPKDEQLLASNDVEGYRYYSCAQCSGVWIPGAELDKALRPGCVDLFRNPPSPVASAIQCATCGESCLSFKHRDCALDVCSKCHGVWLDPGEASRIKDQFPERSDLVRADEERTRAKGEPGDSTSDLLTVLLLQLGL